MKERMLGWRALCTRVHFAACGHNVNRKEKTQIRDVRGRHIRRYDLGLNEGLRSLLLRCSRLCGDVFSVLRVDGAVEEPWK